MKRDTFFKFSMLIIAFFLTANAMFGSSKRMVLVEEFTQWNCPPCASYNQTYDPWAEQNTDKIVPVAYHAYWPGLNNDPMHLCDATSNRGRISYYAVNGVPNAIVAGNHYNGAPAVSSLTTAVNQVLALGDSPYTITIYYTVTGTLCNVTAQVSCDNAVSNMKFRVCAVEESHHYDPAGSNGEKDFVFINRKMMPDYNGTTLNLGAGETKTFTFSYTIDPTWNADKMFVIGFVQNDLTKEVYQAAKGTKGAPTIEFTADVNTPAMKVLGSGEEMSMVYTLKNLRSYAVTYTVTTGNSTRTPGDWTANVIMPSIVDNTKTNNIPLANETTLQPNESKQITLKLMAGQTVGIGDATINVREKGSSGAAEGNGMITALSSNVQYVEVMDDDPTYSLSTSLTNAGLGSYLSLNSAEFVPVANQLSNLKTVVWTCGEDGAIDATKGQTLSSMITAGTPLLISGVQTVGSIYNNATTILFSLGIGSRGVCYQGYGTGAVRISGYPGDPISDGFDQQGTLIKYLTFGISINDSRKAFPVIKFKTVDTCIGVRSVTNTGKVVFFGFNPKIINNSSAKDDLIKKSLKWLAGLGPKISADLSGGINFGNVATNAYKDTTLILTNNGTDPLTVNSMRVADFQGLFLIQSPSVPFTISAGGTQNVVLRFAPNFTSPFSDVLTITSNAVDFGTLTINVSGTGVKPFDGPQITTSVNTVSFGSVPIDKSKDTTFVLTNSGTQPLTVTGLTVGSAFVDIYTFPGVQTPFTLQPKETKIISVHFAPQEVDKDYNGILYITSNVGGQPYQVNLSGKGDLPAAVNDNTTGNDNFSMKASPNPFLDKVKIDYTIGSASGNHLLMYVIDVNGREVSRLLENTVTPGQYNIEFSGRNLASGIYYVIGKLGNQTLQLPIVLKK